MLASNIRIELTSQEQDYLRNISHQVSEDSSEAFDVLRWCHGSIVLDLLSILTTFSVQRRSRNSSQKVKEAFKNPADLEIGQHFVSKLRP